MSEISPPESLLDTVAAARRLGVSPSFLAKARNVGVDGWIPARTKKDAPQDLDLRLAFLLLHADGHASVGDLRTEQPKIVVLWQGSDSARALRSGWPRPRLQSSSEWLDHQ